MCAIGLYFCPTFPVPLVDRLADAAGVRSNFPREEFGWSNAFLDFARGLSSWTLHVLWLWPIVGVALTLSTMWWSGMTRAAVSLRKRANPSTALDQDTFRLVGAALLRLLLVLVAHVSALALAGVVSFFALPSALAWALWLASQALLSFLYAFSLVDIIWSAQGVSVEDRIRRAEMGWPALIGYGVWLLAVSQWGGLSGSTALYSVAFTLLLLSAAQEASANPTSGSGIGTVGQPTKESTGKVPRLPLFGAISWAVLRLVRRQRPSQKRRR